MPIPRLVCKEEASLRRNAELLSEDLEHKCRELEASVVQHSGKNRMHCHEELAFKDSELEETRLELEVERERHREEVEELRSDLSVAQQQQQQQNGDRVVSHRIHLTEDDFEYVSQCDNPI